MKIKYNINKMPEQEIKISIENLLAPVDNDIGSKSPTSIFELDFKLCFNRIFFVGALPEITSKNLNDWKENELLPVFSIDGAARWTRFNFLEVVWLLCIKELKRFGIPNPIIKKIKDELIFSEEKYRKTKEQFNLKETKKDSSFNKYSNEDLLYFSESLAHHSASGTFNNVVSEIMVERVNSRIIVLSDGDSYYYRGNQNQLEKRIFEEEYSEATNPVMPLEKLEQENFISVSLSNLIIKNLLLNAGNFQLVGKFAMTDAEINLINLLRGDNVTEIKATLKNKRIENIAVTEQKKLAAEARVCELIMKGGYQDFQFKTQDGSITAFQRTTKYKY